MILGLLWGLPKAAWLVSHPHAMLCIAFYHCLFKITFKDYVTSSYHGRKVGELARSHFKTQVEMQSCCAAVQIWAMTQCIGNHRAE